MLKPKQKRSRDGCQKCKELRLKCDKTKPNCQNCCRKRFSCDYSKKFTWVFTDEADSRHPSFKNRQRKPSKKDEFTSETNSYDEMFDTSKDYEVLFNAESGLEKSNDEVIKNICHNGVLRLDPYQISKYQRKFSSFFRSFPHETFNLFLNNQTGNIFTHYLLVTCVSLDPLNGSGPSNLSEKFFVPFAVYNPATLHGILTISATQLSNSNPEYKKLAMIHKSLSYKHLFNILNDPDEAIGIMAVCSIVCQLSVEITESGLQNWRFHIDALRKIVREREKKKMKNDQLMWFLYLRISRYDNFATLTTGERPLFANFFDLEDFKYFDPLIKNFDSVYGVPSKICFFCAELSYISRQIYQSQLKSNVSISQVLKSLGYDEVGLRYRLNDLLVETNSDIKSDDWRICEVLWKCSMVLHYYQSVYNISNNKEIENITMQFLHSLSEIQESDGFFCSNLSFPIASFTLSIPSNKRHCLIEALDFFYNKTNIGTFHQLKRMMNSTWDNMDDGAVIQPRDKWKLEKDDEWNLVCFA